MDFLLYNFLLLTLMVLVHSESSDGLHCTVLDGDGRYRVCWKTNGQESSSYEAEIIFGVNVEAHGYVGFGLSPNGGMAGSDIVTGWIIDGKTYFQDRHGVGNKIPEIDASSDWELLHGSENDTHTSLVFRRKFDTCDEDDMKVDDSTMRLIYAYSDEDPTSENDLQYHQNKRGAKSVLLLQPARKNLETFDNSEFLYWDVLSPNFTITSNFYTMYWCNLYRTPALSSKHHIVMVEPLIQEGHEAYVHHLLLYQCVGANPEEYDPHLEKEGHECYHPNMPDVYNRCEGVTLAWAVGGENLVFPEHVGLPIESNTYFMIEIHYDNPQRHHDIVDSSGFRIYYTSKLREQDAGNLMIGSTVSPRLFVPPKIKAYTVAGHSNTQCLELSLPKSGIKIIGTLLHAHLLGSHLKARHFRNQTELPPLADDKNYDFNYQEYRLYSEEVDFLPGDQITMECTYDSSDRSTTTFGGLSTKEEMCLGFFLYYPKIEVFGVTSVPKLVEINTALNTSFVKEDAWNGHLKESLKNFNWDSVDTKAVEELLRNSQHDTHCYLGDGNKNSVKSATSYPADLQPYIEKSTCTPMEFDSGSGSMYGKLTNIFLSYTLLRIFFYLNTIR